MNTNNNIWLDGMMGLVVGDALGSPAQFRRKDDFKYDPVRDMEYCKCFDMPPGSWTDDSSLAIATLDALITKNGYDLKAIADNFEKWLFNGEFTPFGNAYDVGQGCAIGITRYHEGVNPKESGDNDEYSNGNGSLMRIMPLCLYAYEMQKTGKMSEDEAIQIIHEDSGITHRHLRAQMACGLYYYMVKSILDNKSSKRKKNFNKCLKTGIRNGIKYYDEYAGASSEKIHFSRIISPRKIKRAKDIRSSGYVIDTIESVVYNLIITDSYEECLLRAVNMGGDADTVGAIAGGLAGLYYGYDAIPDRWISEVQRREYIEELCDKANENLSATNQ